MAISPGDALLKGKPGQNNDNDLKDKYENIPGINPYCGLSPFK